MISDKTIREIESAFEAREYERARDLLIPAVKQFPDQPMLRNKLAHAYLRLKQFEKAESLFLQAARILQEGLLPVSIGLSELYGHLDNEEKTKLWHARAIDLKDELSMARVQADNLPKMKKSNRKKRVIAYSLYGDSAIYLEGIFLTLVTAQKQYPDFEIHIYTDSKLPSSIRKRLQGAGAVIKTVSPDMKSWHPTMWRFMAMADPDIDVLLLRDADSVVLDREKKLVKEWLKSDCPAHIIRDWPAHTPLILAGLFGLKGHYIQGLQKSVKVFLESHPMKWGIDQNYLAGVIWPLIRDDALIHDRISGDQPFPAGTPKDVSEHIGIAHENVFVKSNRAFKSGFYFFGITEAKSGLETFYPAVEHEGMASVAMPKRVAVELNKGPFALRLAHKGQPAKDNTEVKKS